ncbi:MAG TPA: DUF2341 domain-containing protein, partial [Bacteroidetes bacterium]|nr:DUF2341 domain-containing protein [Bacteroidota bacterium]
MARCKKIFFFFLVLILSVSNGYSQWLSGYSHRKKIVIDHTRVAGDLTNFPVLVNITDGELATEANGGFVTSNQGYDIQFSQDHVNALDHQIDLYEGVSGQLVVWVRIPSLSSTTDTEFYIYYGNSSITSPTSTTNTWDANFMAIWHFTSDDFSDATGNGNNATNFGTSGIPSFIGTARDFDGSASYLSAAHDVSLDMHDEDRVTLQAWVRKSSAQSGWIAICQKSDYSYNLHFNNGNNPTFTIYDTGFRTAYASTNLSNNTWYHLAGTFDGGIVRIYINGVDAGSTTASHIASTSYDVGIGENLEETGRFFHGIMDELRISNKVRSADWLLTEYRNQSNPSSFYRIEESNNNPCDATELTVGSSCHFSYFSNKYADDSGIPDPGCNWTSGNKDVWFHLTAPSSGQLHIDAESGTLTNGSMAVYRGTCSSLTLITCDDDYHGAGLMPYLELSGLTPGEDLWIRFWGNSGTSGTFGLCAYNPCPEIFTVTGGGSFCPDAVNGSVTLNDSHSGSDFEYRLYKNGVVYGTMQTGTGGPLNWTGLSEGTYRVRALNTNTGCQQWMDGSAEVSLKDQPLVSLGYAYRKTLTINGSQIAGNHSDFPVLVKLENDADLQTHVENVSGYDIVFSDQDGNQLFHDLESYDETTGTLIAWVRIPELQASTDYSFYMYYGNPQVNIDQSSVLTWNPDYLGVWHLHNDFTDATAHNLDGTNSGSTDVTGMIADGQAFAGNEIISVDKNALLEPEENITVSLWMRRSGDQNSYAKLVWYGNPDGTPFGPYGFQFDGNNETKAVFHIAVPTGPVWAASNNNEILDNTNYLLTGTYDGSDACLYINDYLRRTTSSGGIISDYDTLGLGVGASITEVQGYTGILDEIRIQSATRPLEWIQTEYRNQSNPSTFLSAGSEEFHSEYSFEVCEFTQQVYSVTNHPDFTYSWAVNGGIISSGQNTNSIIVEWGEAGAGNISLSIAHSVSGCSAISPAYSVNIHPKPEP